MLEANPAASRIGRAPVRFALIGCGAIGRSVLEAVCGDSSLHAAAVIVSSAGCTAAESFLRSLGIGALVASELPEDGIDLVVEVASHAAVTQHVLPALRRGVPSIVASVGALALAGVAEATEGAALAGGTQVQFVSGAMGAIDALDASRVGGLSAVRYVGRKPPLAWMGTPAQAAFDLDVMTSETIIFEGSAREAATLFPRNANVAAIVSLAGLGLDATRVTLVADPATTQNVHVLYAEGAFGSFELTLRNAPLPGNPKTSALAAYSVVRALRQRVSCMLT
jgi:aspartate dehydrogenase